MSTIAKAIAAFLTSLVALLAAVGFDSVQGWVTPSLIEAVSALVGSLIVGWTTWRVPNKPAA